MKNPRTHIENEKALYTDYEIELKVRLFTLWLVSPEGQCCKVNEFFTVEDSRFSVFRNFLGYKLAIWA